MKVFLSCLLLLPLSAFADTIHVDKAYLQGALVLQTPYQTDKTNMKELPLIWRRFLVRTAL